MSNENLLKESMEMIQSFVEQFRDELNSEYSEVEEMFNDDNSTPPSYTEFIQLKFITQMIGMSKTLSNFIGESGLSTECTDYIGTGKIKKLTPQEEMERMVRGLGLNLDENNMN